VKVGANEYRDDYTKPATEEEMKERDERAREERDRKLAEALKVQDPSTPKASSIPLSTNDSTPRASSTPLNESTSYSPRTPSSPLSEPSSPLSESSSPGSTSSPNTTYSTPVAQTLSLQDSEEKGENLTPFVSQVLANSKNSRNFKFSQIFEKWARDLPDDSILEENPNHLPSKDVLDEIRREKAEEDRLKNPLTGWDGDLSDSQLEHLSNKDNKKRTYFNKFK
jgi:DNA primase